MQEQPYYEQTGVAMTCRSFAEYVSMFSLDEQALTRAAVLDVAGGASSFAAEVNRRGGDAYAADPLYTMSVDEIEAYGRNEIEVSTSKLARLSDQYCWDYYGDLSNHRATREQSLVQFLEDFARRKQTGRYAARSLPDLGFASERFDLVLCSHFLFLYNEQYDYEFHLAAILELLRVCRKGGEVRIYPLVGFDSKPYPQMGQLLEQLASRGTRAEFVQTRLHFIPGSTDVLRLVK